MRRCGKKHRMIHDQSILCRSSPFMRYTDLSSVRQWHFGTARQWLEIFQLNLLKYQYSTVWVCHSGVPISPVGIKFPLIGNHWIRLIIIRLCSIIQVRKVNIPIFNYLNILLALSRRRDHPFATIIYSKIQPHINNATFRVAEVKLDREIWKHAINGDEKTQTHTFFWQRGHAPCVVFTLFTLNNRALFTVLLKSHD